MSFMDEFNFWLNDDYFDQATKDELLKIKDNEGEIEERFYKELEFGTADSGASSAQAQTA